MGCVLFASPNLPDMTKVVSKIENLGCVFKMNPVHLANGHLADGHLAGGLLAGDFSGG